MANIARSLNALKTGAYAREGLLPWESAADYNKLQAEIFADLQPQRKLEMEIASNIVENRWVRTRLQRTTAIATHRHAFGRLLEESGGTSWSEALTIVRRHHVDQHKALERIAISTREIAQQTTNWTRPEQLEELAQKVVTECETTLDRLTRIEAALDEERDFFREYSPKQLDRRIKLENALDAQFDKLMARLVNLQEARILRDKSRRSQDAAGDSAAERSHDDVNQASKLGESPSRDGRLDLAELDRDDVEEFSEAAKEHPSGDGKGPVDSAKLDRDDDDIDPLAEFVAEAPCAEPDQDDDGTDDWGQPKPSTG